MDHGEEATQPHPCNPAPFDHHPVTSQSTTPTEEKQNVSPEMQTESSVFDICPPKQLGSKSPVVLNPPLFRKNREQRNRNNSNSNSNSNSGLVTLRSGMILLKGYIPLSEQVKIVKSCREMGMGNGGFYQPGYGDESKMHLKMMCLGKNWDPQTRQYGHQRPSDSSRPPNIPTQFLQLVETATRDSHYPTSISPDICIVNFYTHKGRLGLHQDKDESQESIRRGLPVVSLSIGDTADFLYGDDTDVDKAQKLLLQSGDVLIFGGNSRNIFHGVTAIHRDTAPNLLLQETNLRPGRLNLTFRQY